MRAVVQRVLRGSVTVSEEVIGAIEQGLVILLGVGSNDHQTDVVYLAEKVANLRIFEDEAGKLNCSALELHLPLLVVSQFTLYGDCRQGRRPSFSAAAPPAIGEELYEAFCEKLRALGLMVAQGKFRSQMTVEIINDGPVTILLDSQKEF